MSLAIQFLQDRAKQKNDEITARNNTINNNLGVIRACNKNAPDVIRNFKEKFAAYQHEKTNPSTWKKIQTTVAKKLKGTTKKESQYRESRDIMRSLAQVRKTTRKGLKQLTGFDGYQMSRDKLLGAVGNMDAEMGREADAQYYSGIVASEISTDFETMIHDENLTETVEKLRTLDAYIATNPTYEEMRAVMEKMSDKRIRKVLRDYLLKIAEGKPKFILDLYADSETWETQRDKTGYWLAFDAEYKRLGNFNNSYNYAMERHKVGLCFTEMMRHGDEPRIYEYIIEKYVPLISYIEQDSRIYLKLPVHIQAKLMGRINFSEMRWVPTGRRLSRCIYRDKHNADYDRYEEYDEMEKLRHGLPQIAESFGHAIVQTMNPLEKAKFILRRDTSKGQYIDEAFSKDEIHEAAITYLENPEKYEYTYIKIAVEQLSDDEKAIYAKKMVQREDDVQFFHLFIAHVQGEDLDATITLLKKTGHTGNLRALERGIIQDQTDFTECQKNWLKESVGKIFIEENTCRYWVKDMGIEVSQANEIPSLKNKADHLVEHIFVTYFMRIPRHEAHGNNSHIREEAHKMEDKPFYIYISGLIREKIQERIRLLSKRAEISEKLTQ